MNELNDREYELAILLSESQRRYSDILVLLLEAERKNCQLEEEIEKLTHAGVVPRFVERNWK